MSEKTLLKVFAKENLSLEEQSQYDNHASLSSQVIRDIPRLEQVSQIVNHYLCSTNDIDDPQEKLGVSLLQCAMYLDMELRTGQPLLDGIRALKLRRQFPNEWIEALSHYQDSSKEGTRLAIYARDLKTGMVFENDVRFKNGALLITAGNTATPVIVARLQTASNEGRLEEPFQVSTVVHS